MKGITAAVILMLLNMFDAFCTHAFVSNGLASEINPVMNYIININMGLFLWTKVLGVTISSVIVLSYYERYTLIRIATLTLIIVYSVIAIMHMVEIHHICKALSICLSR